MHFIEATLIGRNNMESERLRNSLLAALSHDLRGPLTSMVGLSELLAASKPPLSPQQMDLATVLRDEALRMNALVSNILDIVRIQNTDVKLNQQWQPLEDVVGSALRASGHRLKAHAVITNLPSDFPLLRFDAVLIERVLVNLFDNAAKYTTPGSRIGISATLRGTCANVLVYDNGPGLPPGRERSIFDKFTRGEHDSAEPGVGLGLSICRVIIEAHGSTICASPSPEGGAGLMFALPLGTPPITPLVETSTRYLTDQ
jgi:two-component system, OmpR family, sensor histidine kinase KdpD